MSETGALSFPFEQGDDVLVRVRENGTSGGIVAKFEAKCLDIDESVTGSSVATLSLPWGVGVERARIRPYEAEFEVVADG